MDDKNQDGKKEDQAEQHESDKGKDALISGIVTEIQKLPLKKQKILRELIRLFRRME